MFFNSCKDFFRISPCCTFSCKNPWLGGPWDMKWIFFFTVIFIMIQKNAFVLKKFQIFMHGFKRAILEKLKNCQNVTFEPVHEIWKKNLAKIILLNQGGIFLTARRKVLKRPLSGPRTFWLFLSKCIWTSLNLFK